MERVVIRNRTKSKINFEAPFWQMLKAIGVTIGILSAVVLFYMLYILMWFFMGC